MFLDALRCSHCGAPAQFKSSRLRRVPWWVWFGLILILATVLGWLFAD